MKKQSAQKILIVSILNTSVFILLFFTSINAFSQLNKNDSSLVSAYGLIPYSELSVKLPKASSELRNTYNSVIPDTEIEAIGADIDSFYLDLVQLRNRFTDSDTGFVEKRELENRVYSWNQLKMHNKKLQENLSGILEKLRKDIDKIKTTDLLWSQSMEAINRAMPEANTELISSFISDIDSLLGELDLKSQKLNGYQKKITESSLIINENIRSLETKIINIESTLLSTKGSSLFSIIFSGKKEKAMTKLPEAVDTDQDILPEASTDSLTTGKQYLQKERKLAKQLKGIKSTVGIYITDHKLRYNILIFIFIFLYGILIYAKYLRNNKKRDDEQYNIVNKTTILLNHPLATSFFTFLIITRLFSPLAPPDLYKLLFVLTIVPLMVLIPKVIDNKLSPYIYGIGSLFFIQNLSDLLLYGYIINNVILLILAGVLLTGLIYFINNDTLDILFTNKFTKTLIKAFIAISLLMLSINVISTLIGYYVLEEFIIKAFIWTYFSIFLFITANIITAGIIDLMIHSKVIQQFNSVRAFSSDISLWIRKLLNTITLIFWLYIVSILFRFNIATGDLLRLIWEYEFSIGAIGFSLGNITVFIITIWASLLISRLLRLVLEKDVLNRLTLNRGVAGSISVMMKYLVLTIGFFIAVAAAGMKLDKLAFIFGALSVGIGFGLQNIVNDFISGLILLFDRPINIGDTIAVGELEGVVKNIGIRTSTIQAWNRSEIVVPNGNLVSNKVINWTLSNNLRRLELRVGVAYGSDIKQVMKLLKECAMSHEMVLKDPAPLVWFTDFGESSLDFILLFFYPRYDGGMKLRSEVAVSVEQALREAGISIPYPQTDIHIKHNQFPANEAGQPEP